ncbi:uncharacterized protein LOC136095417 isoform X2 [Hydra vulgaris]|uniref:uncharacterized protein LOC136095417 isoform X2 n=1 Tax=Hydra vulgaris TaxID=6087 RepID=UPI0032EA64B1
METSANDESDQRFALILSELAALKAELNKDASSLPTDQGSSVISTPPAQEVVNNLSSSTSTPNDGIKDSNGFSFNQFLLWRTTHPGPKTRKAFNVWARQGGKDLPNFRWGGRTGSRKGRGQGGRGGGGKGSFVLGRLYFQL